MLLRPELGRGASSRGRRSCACGAARPSASGSRARRRTEQGRRRNKWTPGFGLATCKTVVIDGANVCWAFGREKAKPRAERGEEERKMQSEDPADVFPDIEGLRVVLEQPLWEALSLEPVIFLPTTCVNYANWDHYECSVNGEPLFEEHRMICVENGSFAAGKFCGGGGGGNSGAQPRSAMAAAAAATLLRHKGQRAQAGRKKSGGNKDFSSKGKYREVGAALRSRDDLLLLRFAQKNNAWVLSNDRFRDHPSIQRRGWNGWLKERRIGYSFRPCLSELDVGAENEIFCRCLEEANWCGGTSS